MARIVSGGDAYSTFIDPSPAIPSNTSLYEWVDANGVTWELQDTIDGPAVVALLAGADGFGDVEEQDFVREGPLLDGQTYLGGRSRPRLLMLPVQIFHDSSSIASAFWSGLQPREYGTFRVTTDGETREIQARYAPKGDYNVVTDPKVLGYEFTALNFVADSPYWHGDTISKQFQTAETPRPFFSTGTTEVFNLMSGNTVATATMTNPGDYPAWPLIRVDGPATSFSMSSYFPNIPADVAGDVTVGPGQYLLINTDPTQQTVRLYSSDGSYVSVFDEMTSVAWLPFPRGVDVPIFIQLVGSGSMTVSFAPQYRRAYP